MIATGGAVLLALHLAKLSLVGTRSPVGRR
jgi:hypothetical protein